MNSEKSASVFIMSCNIIENVSSHKNRLTWIPFSEKSFMNSEKSASVFVMSWFLAMSSLLQKKIENVKIFEINSKRKNEAL